MKYSTHIIFSLAFTQTTLVGSNFYSLPLLTGAIVGSLLPDIDHPKSYIGRRVPLIPDIVYKFWGHRTVTHSMLAIILIALISLPLISFGLYKFWYGLIVGYISHLLIDMLNPQGISLFFPILSRFSVGSIQIKSKEENYIFLTSFFIFFGWLFYY